MASLLATVRDRLLPTDQTVETGRVISDGPFGYSREQADRMAREIVRRHRHGKARRHFRDLTAEKYLIHMDGEGSSQWADIVDGMYVMVPFSLSESLRLQRNLLRPVTDNFVAYHTAQEFRVLAESRRDKQSRDKARVDTLFANNLIVTQRLNAVVAEGLYLGAAYGHCPIHVQWRETGDDLYQPVYEGGGEGEYGSGGGMIDFWPGDPWASVYSEGSTRSSIQRWSYDRPVPTQLIRNIFGHIPGVEMLEGRTDMASASRFQRTIRRWTGGGYGAVGIQQGTAAITGGTGNGYSSYRDGSLLGGGGQELSALVCEETAPGIDPDWPLGRLSVAVVLHEAEIDRTHGAASEGSPAILLHDGPLPAARFGAVPIYAGPRSDDVLGAPYVKDLDDLQIQLNHLITLRAEFLVRFARPPLMAASESLSEDTIVTADDSIIEFEGNTPPAFLYPPIQAITLFDSAIAETLDQFFRIAGWQAASRGESRSGDPAAKVVALQQADQSIFGPVNRALQESLITLLQTAHALAKQFMTEPMLVELVGEEWGHIADPWLRREAMSDKPPSYRMVNGFGATPEARAEQLVQLVTMAGADGQPLLTTRQFWNLWPDHSLRPPEIDASQVREARAQAANYWIETQVADARAQYGDAAEQLGEQLFRALGQAYPLERSDNPQEHIEVLDQLVQNAWADPLARLLARWQQGLYYDWMDQIAQQQQQQMMAAEGEEAPQPSVTQQLSGAEQVARTGGQPMNQEQVRAEVQALSEQAARGGATPGALT